MDDERIAAKKLGIQIIDVHLGPSGEAGYVVSLDKAALEAAPSYGLHELNELGGPSREIHGERIFAYYGPYGSIPY